MPQEQTPALPDSGRERPTGPMRTLFTRLA
nr:MAG TPA: hypothetical protein [Caudoviricetes sp.]